MIILKNIFGLFLMGLLIIKGCDNTSEQTASKDQKIGIPPSLVADSVKKHIIRLSDKEIKELQIKTTKISSEIHDYKIVAPGVAEPHPEHVSIISAPVDGRVVNIMAYEGDYVQKGSVILQMESLTFGSLVANYVQAKSEEAYQQSRLERMKKLVAKNINSESDLEKVRADYQRASASVNAAYSKLKAIGVAERDIDALNPNKKVTPLLNIYAPISGTIDQRKIDKGESIEAYEKMERIINPEHVMVRAYLAPEDGQFVQKGNSATIMRRKNPEKQISGKVTSINPGLDKDNRSVIVNIPLKIKNKWPLPGANVRIEIETKTPARVIMIPMDAVTYDGDRPVVFVKHSEKIYEKRYIQVTSLRDKYAVVQQGLQPEEQIAINQIFTLKALSRYEKFAE